MSLHKLPSGRVLNTALIVDIQRKKNAGSYMDDTYDPARPRTMGLDEQVEYYDAHRVYFDEFRIVLAPNGASDVYIGAFVDGMPNPDFAAFEQFVRRMVFEWDDSGDDGMTAQARDDRTAREAYKVAESHRLLATVGLRP